MIHTRKFWYALFCVVGVLGFAVIASSLLLLPKDQSWFFELDSYVFNAFKAARTETLTKAAVDITALGTFTVLTWFSIAIFGFLALFRQRLRIIELLVVCAGAALLPRILKLYFARPRPDLADRLVQVSEYSFPSGHALGSSAMYLAFGLLAAEILRSKIQKTFCIGFATFTFILIGLSRIYLGVHYTTDVLAGFCLGSTWTLSTALVFDFYRQHRVKASAAIRI